MINKINIFLLGIIIITFIVFIAVRLFQNNKNINQMKENFRNHERYNRACCGNLDWYLGEKKYKGLCPDSTPPAFENTRSSHCSYLQENFTSAQTHVPKYYENTIEECNKLGYEPAYNKICSKDNKVIIDSLCKCSDRTNGDCKVCLPSNKNKIND
jgi:hypothetical protein